MFKAIRIQFGTPSIETAKDVVFGREELAEKLWGSLSEGSVRLLSERRMGKTWLLMLAMATKPEWAISLFFDAEGCSSAPEFIWKLNEKLHESKLIDIERRTKITDWFRRVAQRVQGQNVAGVEIPEIDPWPALLESTCRHLAGKVGDKKAVVIIDEFPFFLDKLIKDGRGDDAIHFLDTLRQLRQTLPNFRLVFCGSLGLHLVLDSLQREGYTGRPVNDMQTFDVPPLSEEMAVQLAGGLITGEQVPCKNVELSANAVALAACKVPFYIQHIVKWMQGHAEGSWTPKRISHIPEEMFEDSGDPGDFSYYDSRLTQYYPEDIADRARVALDMLSRNPKGESFDGLLNLVRHSPKTAMLDSQELLRILEVLRDDHYLLRSRQKWIFKLEIVRRWWLTHRGGMAL